MSSDFGDDSGEAMLRWAERVGERGGARALIEAAGRLGGSAAEVRERPHGTSAGPGMREWARLDLATVADDPAGLEPALVSRLREAGVESIAVDLDGSRALLFKVSDADRVAAALDEASSVAEEASLGGDERPLDLRAEKAREASRALEAGAGRAAERVAAEPTRLMARPGRAAR